MRSGTICCISDFKANDNGISPSESRRFKSIAENPSLGCAVMVSKNKIIVKHYKHYKKN